VRESWARLQASPDAARYIETLAKTPLVRELLAGKLPLDWSSARIVSDDPAKVLHPPERTELHLLPRLVAALGEPKQELDIISPYFVPTEDGTAALVALAARGVKVRVLTNSLAATDVAPVHAGYAKYREALLRGGVRIWELKPSAGVRHRAKDGRGGSDASLHAKTFGVDRQRLFIGSFNLDPRSSRLNTEIGLVAESPRLAGRLATAMDKDLVRDAYEVRLAGGRLEWLDGEARHTSEPNAGMLRRVWIGFLSILPIEWLL